MKYFTKVVAQTVQFLEVCQDYLKKGSLAFLEGRLKTDKYEDKGDTKYFTKS
jgi:single-stranded DNA-binding protein